MALLLATLPVRVRLPGFSFGAYHVRPAFYFPCFLGVWTVRGVTLRSFLIVEGFPGAVQRLTLMGVSCVSANTWSGVGGDAWPGSVFC